MFEFIYYETILCTIIASVLYYKYKIISKIINVYDIPNHKLKKHKNKTPISGGILNLFIFTFFFLITFNFSEIFYFPIFLIIYTLFGFIDDKYDLNPYIKLIGTTLIVTLLIFVENNLLITSIKFNTNSYVLDLGFLSLLFTVLCILLLTHSLNMMDGVNGYSSSYKISIVLTFILYVSTSLGDFPAESMEYKELIWLLNISILYLFILILFIFLNYRGFIFFGDGGIYFGSLIICYTFIKLNKILPTFSPEIIFVMLILPGIDMFRLFLIRIYNKNNPFKGDLNHFHHLVTSKFPKINLVFTILTIHLVLNCILFYQNSLFFPVLVVYLITFFFIVGLKNETN